MFEVDRRGTTRLYKAEAERKKLVRRESRYKVNVPAHPPQQHVADRTTDEEDPVMM